ncbi:catalase [Dongia rigui]|uniref:Catalase n=1 Tax=Dongia rigui TaxID=940149 RepID=A0ABU5DYA4_9PROT|nr:catalase [Dongia rigui]MDY0871924.1 catalase [Dongia rigui]
MAPSKTSKNAAAKPSAKTASAKPKAFGAKGDADALRGSIGQGGETHQRAAGSNSRLTSNQGTVISDNQNSLRQGDRGPSLLEDFILREKITHFDHERIPERIVHARGSGAHGTFQVYQSQGHVTKAAFLQDPKVKTPVFVRFSTVAGGAGSIDTARDVRGFAVKFYTSEGNFDLVGNNIPVFFIQDAMKFPDLVHSVKMEPDRGFPQAASAHDTFWDFVSLMPESMHMLTWVMSDRAIPRSYRMMEGFGVHTFRLIDAKGKASFVKFHWRPLNGSFSLVWDEAVKLGGADYDFHRRDLWEAIDAGNFPEYELAFQVFDEKFADSFDFDVLDATKLIPEELVPLQVVGKMTLNRNPDNFFAETEQVAFHPGHVVPGIDFSNDPLLQGRLFSYLDTQLIRLGGPNFHQIPINQPKCPFRNLQRDGHMQMQVPKGQVNYEPNSLDPEAPRESPTDGFVSHPDPYPVVQSDKVRGRAESFGDHYSQARQFFLSQTKPEQDHIVGAFAFELGKVSRPAIRARMLAHLNIVHKDLGAKVAEALGMEIDPALVRAFAEPKTLKPSPALSLLAKAPQTIKGRKVGVLVTEGSSAALIAAIYKAAMKEGAKVELVGPRVSGVSGDDGAELPIDHALYAAPSVVFDAVIAIPSKDGVAGLLREAAAIDWLRDAFGHLKAIGHNAAAAPLLTKAGIEVDEAVVDIEGGAGLKAFIAAAKQHRLWSREPKVRSPGD